VWASILPDFPESDFDDLSYDWRPVAERIAAPTLVVHGADDPMPVAGSEEWARAVPQGRLVVIPDAGHYPQADLLAGAALLRF
jgi:pimeloyl-ACP methyl ester carboxylesterase